MNENLRAEWYVFYTQQGQEVTVKTMRISASCLGDAETTAKELASRCNLYIVGVAPDLGVGEVPPPTTGSQPQ